MYGRTPMHYAAMYGNDKILVILLENKGIPNVRDKTGLLPINLVCMCKPINVCAYGECDSQDEANILDLLKKVIFKFNMYIIFDF